MIGKRKGPVLRQCQANLRNRTGINTQSLATTTQSLILQFHRILLGTDTQHTMQPASFHKSLLNYYITRIMNRCCHIQAISDAPATGRICTQRTDDTTTEIPIILLQRTESMLIGIEPKRSLTLGEGPLHLYIVMNVLAQVQFTRIYILLPKILGRNRER